MRFKVTRELSARYVEIYEIDAANREEAERAQKAGQARCVRRAFETVGGRALIPLKTVEAHQEDGFPNFAFPKGEEPGLQAFNNARFVDMPGKNNQCVVQEFGT